MIGTSVSASYRSLWLVVIALTVTSCSTPPSPEPPISRLSNPDPIAVAEPVAPLSATSPKIPPTPETLRSALEQNASVQTLQTLLDSGVIVADSDLLYAVMNGLDPEIVMLLRVNGATLNRDDQALLTRKLGSALSGGQADPNHVRLLLDNGADSTAETTYAIDPATGLLAEPQADGTVKCQGTALHQAAGTGDLQTVKLLLEHGADPKARDRCGAKPRDLATAPAVIALLDEHSTATPADIELIEACRQGDFNTAEKLIEAGADLNAEEPNEPLRFNTPLMNASRGHTKIVELLLDKGADVNRRSFEETPLTIACELGDTEIAQRLIAAGARVNVDDQFIHETPLMKACRGHVGIIKLLLDHEAQVNPTGFHLGKTPLTIACTAGRLDIVKLLLAREAEVNPQVASDDGSPGANVIYPPLVCAAKGNHVEIAKLLLASGAEVNARDMHGRTALIYAVNPDPSVCLPNEAFDLVKTLTDAGADVNVQLNTKTPYDNGFTPLMLACRHRRPFDSLRTIKLLLETGADPTLKNAQGQTALTIATARNPEAAELIEMKTQK